MTTFIKTLFFLLLSFAVWSQPLISEGFEQAAFPPSGWTNGGAIRSTNNPNAGSASAAFNGKDDYLITPLLVNPETLTFWYKRSSNTTAWVLRVEAATSLSGPWTTLHTITSSSTTYQQATVDLSSYTSCYIRFYDARSSGTHERYLDDVVVTKAAASCSAPVELRFEQEPPMSVTQGAVHTLKVKAVCSNGSTATSYTGAVTLTLQQPGCGYIQQTVNAINGVATFSNVKILRSPQANLRFKASSGALTPAVSSVFQVTVPAGAANTILIRQNDFDANNSWVYTAETTSEYGSGGSTGANVVGVVSQGGTNVLRKSYSVSNGAGEKGAESTVTFDNITGLSVYDDIFFSFNVLSFGAGTGAGNDKDEDFRLDISTDNGMNWITVLIEKGYSNRLFSQSNSPVLSLSLNNPQEYSSGSQSAFKLNVGQANQFKFRFVANNNRTNENWAIDNVKLTGIKYDDATPFLLPAVTVEFDAEECNDGSGVQLSTDVTSFQNPLTYMWTPAAGLNSPSTQNPVANPVSFPQNYTVTVTDAHGCKGTANVTVNMPGWGGTHGLWTGVYSSDWFDCRNWSDRKVPDVNTDVVIDQRTSISCEIVDDEAFCRSLRIISGTDAHPDLEIQTTGALKVGEDILLQKSAGTGESKLTLKDNAVLECRNLTIKGFAAGVEQALVVNEVPTTRFIINGNLQVDQGGILDMDDNDPVTTDGTIYLRGNWMNNAGESYFHEGQSKVILDGTSSQVITTTGGEKEQFYVLEIDKPSGEVKLGTDVQAVSNLTMKRGNIETGTFLFELGKGTSSVDKGELDYHSGFIVGRMKRWFSGANSGDRSGLFPLGEARATVHNRFVTVEYAQAASSAGYLLAEFIPSGMGLSGLPIPAVNSAGAGFEVTTAEDEGYWKIDNENGKLTDGLYKIRCTGEGFSTITDLNKLTLLKRVQTIGPDWFCTGVHLPVSGSVNMPVVSRENMSGWSNFGFGGGAVNPLPVVLKNFTLQCEATDILALWETASEQNSSYFEIEKSGNGKEWVKVGSLQAAGNSSLSRQYELRFPNRSENVTYYRMKQVDLDGKNTVYMPQSIRCDVNETAEMIVYPNPSTGEFEISFIGVQPLSTVRVEIYTTEGKKLKEQDFWLENAEQKISIQDIRVTGTYFLRAKSRGKEWNQKVLIF